MMNVKFDLTKNKEVIESIFAKMRDTDGNLDNEKCKMYYIDMIALDDDLFDEVYDFCSEFYGTAQELYNEVISFAKECMIYNVREGLN